jgi:hypothetical protein
MPFRWLADPGSEAEGVVPAVDVTRHARLAGFEGATLLSRGVWARFIGDGVGQEGRFAGTLQAAWRQMARPTQVSEDGAALVFSLRLGQGTAPVVAIVDPERASVALMLWREFTHRSDTGSLRVRVVAEEEPRPSV